MDRRRYSSKLAALPIIVVQFRRRGTKPRRLHFCLLLLSLFASDSLKRKEASMKAVVMAGGEGSRLRPLTIRRPKPMVPIVGKPVMQHILYLLKPHGITEMVVCVQYLAGSSEDYFGNASEIEMQVTYSPE